MPWDKLKKIQLHHIFTLVVIGRILLPGVIHLEAVMSYAVFIITTQVVSLFKYKKETTPTEVEALKTELDRVRNRLNAMEMRLGFEAALP